MAVLLPSRHHPGLYWSDDREAKSGSAPYAIRQISRLRDAKADRTAFGTRLRYPGGFMDPGWNRAAVVTAAGRRRYDDLFDVADKA